MKYYKRKEKKFTIPEHEGTQLEDFEKENTNNK